MHNSGAMRRGKANVCLRAPDAAQHAALGRGALLIRGPNSARRAYGSRLCGARVKNAAPRPGHVVSRQPTAQAALTGRPRCAKFGQNNNNPEDRHAPRRRQSIPDRKRVGTPMGDLLRRFWLPVLLSEELPEADGPPKKSW